MNEGLRVARGYGSRKTNGPQAVPDTEPGSPLSDKKRFLVLGGVAARWGTGRGRLVGDLPSPPVEKRSHSSIRDVSQRAARVADEARHTLSESVAHVTAAAKDAAPSIGDAALLATRAIVPRAVHS